MARTEAWQTRNKTKRNTINKKKKNIKIHDWDSSGREGERNPPET
jgi:hypothetical protein